ncbi:MAG: Mrp/NBP35 family ATP-binding protein [Deltaproteobacteria bacterium]|nr:Mrp/NBP35 family ATP-binding protein [Deltaproteobacteria bacterium]
MKYVIAVVSGKGGVGKSTVAVNLAVSIANTGAKVALIDCDFYGPSIPTLMGPGEVAVDHERRLIPPVKYGVKYISIGFFLQNPDDPVIWRGPMFQTAMRQMFEDVSWGEVDFCIVDMPPGTGDAQLSLAQNFPLSGAVVVTTPQEVALADVRKAVNMLAKVNVPILGVVENMAGFVTPDGQSFDIFGTGGGEKLANMFQFPLLATFPLEMSIREGGDSGEPVATNDSSAMYPLFRDLAEAVISRAEEITADQPQLTVVN